MKCPGIKAPLGWVRAQDRAGAARLPFPSPRRVPARCNVLSLRGISPSAGRGAGGTLGALKGLPETRQVWRGRAGVRLGPLCLRGPGSLGGAAASVIHSACVWDVFYYYLKRFNLLFVPPCPASSPIVALRSGITRTNQGGGEPRPVPPDPISPNNFIQGL